MTEQLIAADVVERDNAARKADLERDYAALGEQLDRRGIDIDAILDEGRRLRRRDPVLGRRHRRHALRALSRPRRAARHLRQDRGLRRHPAADPRHADRLAAYPLGQGRSEPAEAGGLALRPRLRRDELQHLLRRQRTRSSPTSSARSATPTPARARQAVEHNLECIEIGKTLGSKALTVWIGDGSNFPGPVNFTKAFERYLEVDARDL